MSLAFSFKSSKEERIEELVRNRGNMKYRVKFLTIEARHYEMQSGGDSSGPKKLLPNERTARSADISRCQCVGQMMSESTDIYVQFIECLLYEINRLKASSVNLCVAKIS